MDKEIQQKMQADLEAYRAQKKGSSTSGASGDIAKDLEAYRLSKQQAPEAPKEGGGFGGFLKGLVSAPATILARPFQAGAQLLGASPESVDAFSKKISGGLIAPVPQNIADVKKDVGRGIQTAAFGLPGLASGGAAFGVGASLEQGNDLLSAETAFQTALGAGGAKVLGFVGKPLLNASGKVVGKITPQILKDVASKGATAIQDFAARHKILPDVASKAINTGAQKLENVANKPFQIPSMIAGNLRKRVATGLEKDVDALLTKTKGVIGKSQLAEKKNVNLKEILSEPNIFKGLKVENGRINPDEAITIINNRKDALLDAKRALLPELDRFMPKISRSEVRKRAIASIQGKYSPADEADIINAINRQIDALPEEMSIVELDSFRARFRQSSRDAKGMQKRNSEYTALENATRDTVFDVTDNLPFDTNKEYQAVNKMIKDLIETEDFLDRTIRGQIVKGGRLTNLTGRAIGAIAGSQGGILGTLAGSEIGGAVSNIIVNNQLGSGLKMRLIREMTDNPAILKKAEDILSKARDYKPKLLESPKEGSARQTVIGPKPIQLPKRTASAVEREEVGRIQSQLSAPKADNMSLQNTATNIANKVPKKAIPKTILKKPKKSVKLSPVPEKLGKNKGITEQTEPLAAEARKYKSAEEFVKSQKLLYHGSPVPLKRFSNKKGGVFFTEEYADATGFAGSPDNVYEGYLNFKKPLTIDAKGAKWDKLKTKYGESTREVVSNAEKDGYDGVIFKNIIDNVVDDVEAGIPGTIYYAYKPEEAFLNESQLIELYKKVMGK